ncbi:hypothetical protein [Klebsiella michiganensis]|uniref:hypothetical protein n=1 Tax=Klebsiella michiganensis TaxID=1134687 RepID=UPI0034D38D32
MSYTPGPWESMLIHGDNHIIRKGSFRKEGAGSVSYQCVVDCVDDIDDARLIAAAPELLEPLQGLLTLYEYDEGCRDLTEYKRARSAIAKATVTAH